MLSPSLVRYLNAMMSSFSPRCELRGTPSSETAQENGPVSLIDRQTKGPPVSADLSLYLLGLLETGQRTTGLESGSKPVMRHSATSPSRTTTAPGVPVEITSPGTSVMTRE